jgi:ABC-type uncharacterized transport system ATPase subunit
VIEIDNLHKAFASRGGPIRAVDGVSFRAADGEITGLLGPNGAGDHDAQDALHADAAGCRTRADRWHRRAE